MKRHNWLALGLGLSLLAAGCGDDEKSQGHLGDGEVDGGDLSDQLRGLQDDVAKLGMEQTNLDGRLGALEKPKDPSSCSAGELCIPDGVDLSREGLKPIIDAFCTRETTCCTPGELSWIFGPAIKNAADCEASFNDLVNNGIVASNEAFSPFLDEVVRVAHALNDSQIHVSIDAAAVSACAAVVAGVKCPGADEPTAQAGCRPPQQNENACAISSLLKGLERAGDTCDPYSEVPECGEGLACRGGFSGGSQTGLCAAKATAGDRCTGDEDCDDLFCNFATGQCQARAKEGEACVYVDPTFQFLTPLNTYNYVTNDQYRHVVVANGDITKIDCEDGLSCDPVSNTCAKYYCDAGAFCFSNADCPADNACLHGRTTAMQTLANRIPSVGVCGPAVTGSGACHVYGVENDCASTRCGSVVNGVGACLPALAADGAACTTGADCQSGACGTDHKCSPVCDVDCEGAACRSCAASAYCAPYYVGSNEGYCEPLIANGGGCDLGYQVFDAHYDNKSCASGYCDGSVCTAKSAAGGSCAPGHHAACPEGQFCKGTTCTAQPAIGDTCAAADACGPADTRLCWDVDGALSGTVKRCYEGNANNNVPSRLPAGVFCDGSDDQCEKGWCRESGNTLCREPVADGAACNLDGATPDHCGADSFCATAPGTDAGTCEKRGGVGDPCDPRFYGVDCVGGNCALTHDAFLCDLSSLPEERTYCHADIVF